MQRWLILLLAAMTLCSCCKFGWCFHKNHNKSEYLKPKPEALDKVNYQSMVDVVFGWGTQLHYDRDLLLKCSCVVFNDKVKKIKMQFVTQAILELQEARELLVYIVEGLLSRVNGHVGFQNKSAMYGMNQFGYDSFHSMNECVLDELGRPIGQGLEGVLEKRPFTADNLEITVAFESFHGLFVDPTFNGWMWLKNGIVAYGDFRVYFSETDPYGCKYEPYTLTKQLVEIENKVKMPYVNPQFLGRMPFRERYVPPVPHQVPTMPRHNVKPPPPPPPWR